jgi:hypothetical protein
MWYGGGGGGGYLDVKPRADVSKHDVHIASTH